MAVEEMVNESTLLLEDMAVQFGQFGKWLQAVGLIVVLWIVFQIIGLWFNRRKKKEIIRLREDIKRVEEKIDKLSKKRK